MANRFWTGTGTWDNASTANWGTVTGGTGASPPAVGDAVIFDANSTSCTVAATINGSNTVASIVASLSSGTIDFSVNNPSITAQSFVANGAGSPIIKMGSGTFTTTGANGWDMTSANASSTFSSSTIVMGGVPLGNAINFVGAGKTYGTVTFSGRTSGTLGAITGANTFGTLTFSGPGRYDLASATIQTVTAALNLSGTGTGLVFLQNSNANSATVSTLAITGATVTASYAAFRSITASGGTISGTAIFDLGNNTGVTASSPPAGGGGSVIGS